jgi:hypothetical protein
VGHVALEIPFTVSGECERACSPLPKPNHVLLLYFIYGVFGGFTSNFLRSAVGLGSGRCVLRHPPHELGGGCGRATQVCAAVCLMPIAVVLLQVVLLYYHVARVMNS